MSSMVDVKLCRACLGSEQIKEVENKDHFIKMFEDSTQLKVVANSPFHLCEKCIPRLQSAFEFRRECIVSSSYFNHIQASATNNINAELVPVVNTLVTAESSAIEDELELFIRFDHNPENEETEADVSRQEGGNPDISNVQLAEKTGNIDGETPIIAIDYEFLPPAGNSNPVCQEKIDKSKVQDTPAPETVTILDSSDEEDDKENLRKIVNDKPKPQSTEFSKSSNDQTRTADSPTESRIPTESLELFEPYLCGACNACFSQKTHCEDHILLSHGQKILICEFCGKHFDSKVWLAVHLAVHASENGFKCEYCEDHYVSKDDLLAHISFHTGTQPFKCNLCRRSFTVRLHLKNHMGTHKREKPFTCDHCEKRFRFKINWIAHIQTHNGRRLPGKRRFNCQLCNKDFKTNALLKSHVIRHSGEKPFACEQCGNRFWAKRDLNVHMRNHTDTRRYECEVCKNTFAQMQTLKVHMRIHTGELPYECNKCLKKFRASQSFKLHMRRHEEGKIPDKPQPQKQIECDKCNAIFYRKVDLKRHVCLLFGEKVTSHTCVLCNTTFDTLDAFDRHMQMHVEEILDDIRCRICNQEFSSKYLLDRHVIIHSDNYPWKCDKCDRVFLRASFLRNHEKEHASRDES